MLDLCCYARCCEYLTKTENIICTVVATTKLACWQVAAVVTDTSLTFRSSPYGNPPLAALRFATGRGRFLFPHAAPTHFYSPLFRSHPCLPSGNNVVVSNRNVPFILCVLLRVFSPTNPFWLCRHVVDHRRHPRGRRALRRRLHHLEPR